MFQHCLFLSWMNGASLFGEALTTPKATALSSLIEGGRSRLLLSPQQRNPTEPKSFTHLTQLPVFTDEKHSGLFPDRRTSVQGNPHSAQKLTLHLPSSLGHHPAVPSSLLGLVLHPGHARPWEGACHLHTNTQTLQPLSRIFPFKNLSTRRLLDADRANKPMESRTPLLT